MAVVVGLLWRNAFPKLTFHLKGILGTVRDSQLSCNTDTVGIADISRLTVDITQNQIGCFAAHTGKGRQLLHGSRNFSVMIHQQLLGTGHNIPRLSVVESAGMNIVADLCGICLSKAFQRRKALIQSGGDFVDPFIRTLGRQAYRKQELIVLRVLQGTKTFWIEFLQRFNDAFDRSFGFHVRSPLPTEYHKAVQKTSEKSIAITTEIWYNI